jgi:hypothetical protein
VPYLVLSKHFLQRTLRDPKMAGTIRKIAKIFAFPVFVGIWLAGWTLYSNNEDAQVSEEKWKMIIIPNEAYKK